MRRLLPPSLTACLGQLACCATLNLLDQRGPEGSWNRNEGTPSRQSPAGRPDGPDEPDSGPSIKTRRSRRTAAEIYGTEQTRKSSRPRRRPNRDFQDAVSFAFATYGLDQQDDLETLHSVFAAAAYPRWRQLPFLALIPEQPALRNFRRGTSYEAYS